MSELNQPHNDQQHANSEVDYERSDAKPFILGAALVIGMILVGLALIGVDNFFILAKEKMIFETAMKPESLVLRDVRSREDALLTTYGVVDSTKGIYRIPIAEAMKKMAEEAYANEKSQATAR